MIRSLFNKLFPRKRECYKVSFGPKGFVIHEPNGPHSLPWEAVQRVEFYKIGHITIDEICVNILLTGEDEPVCFCEDTGGFGQIVELLQKNLPCWDEEWYGKVCLPAFEKCLTVAFDREECERALKLSGEKG